MRQGKQTILGETTIQSLAGMVKGGAGVLSALALGAANTKLFVDAAGTAPEFALGNKIGTFSINQETATGTQAITNVGFKPSLLIFFAVQGNVVGKMSVGFDSGSARYCIWDRNNATEDTWGGSSTRSITVYEGTSTLYAGLIDSMDADGFTIGWTRTGTPTGIAEIYYAAFR